MKKNRLIALTAICIVSLAYTSCKKDTPDPGPGVDPCTEKNWYEDADGDGLGNPNVTLFQCEQPDGYVEDNSDPIDKEVQRNKVPFLMKISGETCPPCGGWGWTAWEDLSSKFWGKGFCMTTYGTFVSNGNFRGQELDAAAGGSAVIQAFQDRFWSSGSKPSFYANVADNGTSAADAETDATNSLTDVPDVAAVLEATIEGEQLTVTSEVEFFDDMPGDYVLGAYLIEDKVVGYQAGYSDPNNAPHHFVMRGSMSEGKPWGEQIVTGGATAGEKHTKTFTVTIPSGYNKENLSYGVIVWRKISTAHVYVNAYTTQGL